MLQLIKNCFSMITPAQILQKGLSEAKIDYIKQSHDMQYSTAMVAMLKKRIEWYEKELTNGNPSSTPTAESVFGADPISSQ